MENATTSNKVFSVIIVLMTVALMQNHGIRFWIDILGGDYWGILWSVAIESATLYWWFNCGKKISLATIASIMVLAGPLYHIASPVFETMQQHEIDERNRPALIEIKENQIADMQALLKDVKARSEHRGGWEPAIQKATDNVTQARTELTALIEAEAPPQALKTYIIAAVQAITLIVVWLISIRAIRLLSKKEVEQKKKKIDYNTHTFAGNSRFNKIHEGPDFDDLGSPPQEDSTTPNLSFEEQVIDTLNQSIKQQKLNQAEWGKQNGITPKNVSLIINHTQRKAAGKEIAPQKQFQKAALVLGIE